MDIELGLQVQLGHFMDCLRHRNPRMTEFHRVIYDVASEWIILVAVPAREFYD